MRASSVRLISARKDIDIQALQTNIHLLAKLKITHSAQRIELQASEEIVINGGGSYSRWKASGIESGTTGTWVAHAASHSMTGATSAPVVFKLPETASPRSNDMVRFVSTDGQPLAGINYALTTSDGQVLRGRTNAQGETDLLKVDLASGYQITLDA